MTSSIAYPEKILFGPDAQQLMEQAGIAEIDFGRLDLSFFYIGEPRLELANHIDALQ